jgi:hypothetical protein
VLVAASLAMLATVSALVAFDGWPRGYGTGSVDSVSVNGGSLSESQILRDTVKKASVGQAAARGAAPAGFVKTPVGAFSAGSTAGLVKTIGPVGPGGAPGYYGPRVIVPYPPPGEGGPTTTPCGSGCTPPPTGPLPQPVQRTVCGAASSYSGGVCGGGSQLSAPQSPPSAPVGPPPAALPDSQAPETPVQIQVPPVQGAPVQVPQGGP